MFQKNAPARLPAMKYVLENPPFENSLAIQAKEFIILAPKVAEKTKNIAKIKPIPFMSVENLLEKKLIE